MCDWLADIEMGRQVTGAHNPVVLYVSGGNTQVFVSLLCTVAVIKRDVYCLLETDRCSLKLETMT